MLILLYSLSMQSMCILLDDQCVEWRTCDGYIVINWLNLCGCEWCECRIYVVDAKFCPDYCVYFHFGPRTHLWRVSNLGLEPCPYLFYSCLAFICCHDLITVRVIFHMFRSVFRYQVFVCVFFFNCVSYLDVVHI